MYEKKVWVNRQSEHPSRRKLTPTGNDGEYDVSVSYTHLTLPTTSRV